MKYFEKNEFIKEKWGGPILNFEGSPGVPLLNFEGVPVSRSLGPVPGVLVQLLRHAHKYGKN